MGLGFGFGDKGEGNGEAWCLAAALRRLGAPQVGWVGGVLERCPNTKIGCLPLAERFAWRHARTQNPKRGARDHAHDHGHAPAPDCCRL